MSRRVTIGSGVEVPAALFFGGGTELESLFAGLGFLVEEPEAFSVVPILIGPTLEWRVPVPRARSFERDQPTTTRAWLKRTERSTRGSSDR